MIDALDDKARTCTIMTRNRLRVSSSSPVTFPPGPNCRLNAYKYSVAGYQRALQIQALEIGVRAQRALCEQCAWSALRPSGNDSNLESGHISRALDVMGSHPLHHLFLQALTLAN
jgi:hypothetical protein